MFKNRRFSFLKWILLFIIFNTICNLIFANSIINEDSLWNKKLIAVKNFITPNKVIKEANVIFPDILKNEVEQSITYVEKFYKTKKTYVNRMYLKGKKYSPKIELILKKHSIPKELKVLVALESAYNANAVSKAGAVGYWQIMDEVAHEYGLQFVKQMSRDEKEKLIKINKKKADSIFIALTKLKDERKNFIKSTTVAARYLKDRYKNLNNNLLLVVASYNCGVGNVWNAMHKTGLANPSFWDIKNYLPAETRAYVMNFISLNVLFNNYDKVLKNTLTFSPTKVLNQNEND